MSNFKTLHSVKFDNVKVTAFYEYKILPVEVIFNVSFSVQPTSYAREHFNNNLSEFIDFLQNRKLGVYAINNKLKQYKYLFPESWKVEEYCGINYTYEHNVNVIKFGNRSALGVDILMLVCGNKENRCKELEKNSKKIISSIKNLQNFQSDKFVTIKSSRKSI